MLGKYRRWGWCACVAALMGGALFAGCEVARSKWGCALLAGAVMVAAAIAAGREADAVREDDMREEIIGGQRLILGDCRDVTLPAGVLCTDPPYPNNAGHFCDAVDIAREVLAAWRGGPALVFWSELEFPPVPLPLVAVHIWHRTNVNGRPYEPVFHFNANGEKRRSGVFAHSVVDSPLRTGCAESEGHPTQKPVALMRWLMQKEQSSCVIDPFMGVGSTLVAAERDGRSGFGVEVNVDFFDAACRRVEAIAMQPNLFQRETQEAQLTLDAMASA